MKPKNKFWTFDNPVVSFLAGIFVFVTGPFAGLVFFSYMWDKPGLLVTKGWLTDFAAMFIQAHLYYSMLALLAGPALVFYAFIRLVVIIGKKLKANQ